MWPYIVDGFSLEELDRFECEQVVHEVGGGVAQTRHDTPVCIVPGLRRVLLCVCTEQLDHYLCCFVSVIQ